MPDPNPNRSLPPEEVESLVSTRLPHLAPGLGRDRTWVWWSGEKPAEPDRAALKEFGFSFTPRPHSLPDGRAAYWFHPCGGAVLRRKGKSAGSSARPRVNTRQQASTVGAPSAESSTAAFAALERLAELLPS